MCVGNGGINRCQLLYIGWINKDLLYSTGNYVQHLVTNHNVKEYMLNIYQRITVLHTRN